MNLTHESYQSIEEMNNYLQGVNDRINEMSLTKMESPATNQLAKEALRNFELFLENFRPGELVFLMEAASYHQLSKNAETLRRFVSTDSYMTIYHPEKGLTVIKEENKRVEKNEAVVGGTWFTM